jgi:hypothetical protein
MVWYRNPETDPRPLPRSSATRMMRYGARDSAAKRSLVEAAAEATFSTLADRPDRPIPERYDATPRIAHSVA